MTGLLAVAIVCGTALFGGRYVLRTLSRRWDNEIKAWQQEKFAEAGRQNLREIVERDQREADREIEARKVSVEERRVAIDEKRFAPAPKPEPIPSDLANRPMQWEDQWMQEQERTNIQALYAEYGDWDEVRRHLAPLSVVQSDEIVAPRDLH
jgi:hypothetical protein